MANVKCPACATVWNVNTQAAAAKGAPANAAEEKPAKSEEEDNSFANIAIIGGLVGGLLMLVTFLGLAIVILNRDSPPSTATAEIEDTIKPLEPEEYRIISKDEATRRRIYKDYRTVAKTSVERPLILPQGTRARQNLEDMLQKTFDRELMHFAALHDITVDDVKEVIKEGDAKVWDDSPRSNAVRDGKRMYAKEKSEGWELKNPNRK